MTPRQRVEAAFRFEDLHPAPYTVWYDAASGDALDRWYGSPQWRSRLRDGIYRANIVWQVNEDLPGGLYRDTCGSIWKPGKPAGIVEPALKTPSLANFHLPSFAECAKRPRAPLAGGSRRILPALTFHEAPAVLAEQAKQKLTLIDYSSGPFETSWAIRGLEDFLCDAVENEAFVESLMDLVTQRQSELLAVLLELPADGVIFSDDYGDQRGVIMGTGRWRRLVKPYIARLYAQVRAAGKLVFHHTCGSVLDIAADLADIGLDVLQSLQAEAMDIYELKRRYGRNLRLWGGLGTQRLLPFGTPEEIIAEIRRLDRELGKGGGYVFSSCKPIMSEVPPANAAAMIDELLRQKG